MTQQDLPIPTGGNPVRKFVTTRADAPVDVRAPDVIVIASVSGGRDSAAASLFLHECGIPHRRAFADTGWEHEQIERDS
jgi:hypothetical protein